MALQRSDQPGEQRRIQLLQSGQHGRFNPDGCGDHVGVEGVQGVGECCHLLERRGVVETRHALRVEMDRAVRADRDGHRHRPIRRVGLSLCGQAVEERQHPRHHLAVALDGDDHGIQTLTRDAERVGSNLTDFQRYGEGVLARLGPAQQIGEIATVSSGRANVPLMIGEEILALVDTLLDRHGDQRRRQVATGQARRERDRCSQRTVSGDVEVLGDQLQVTLGSFDRCRDGDENRCADEAEQEQQSPAPTHSIRRS